jgi:hypothetical protein
MYDGVWKFQDAWTTQLPWVELVFNEQGQVHYVRCRICTFDNDKEKWFTPKPNNLLKHEGCHKAKVSMLGGWCQRFFIQKRYYTCKNERCYTTIDYLSIWDRLQANVLFK